MLVRLSYLCESNIEIVERRGNGLFTMKIMKGGGLVLMDVGGGIGVMPVRWGADGDLFIDIVFRWLFLACEW